MNKKLTKGLVLNLYFNETIDQLEKAISNRWYGHVLRKAKNNFLRKAIDIKVKMAEEKG